MAAPASALSALADLAVDGAIVAGMVLIAMVAIRAFKLLRQSIEDEVYGEAMHRTEYQYSREEIEDGYLDSKGNLYLTEGDRDEAEASYVEDTPDFDPDAAWDEAVEESRREFNGENPEGFDDYDIEEFSDEQISNALNPKYPAHG